MPDAMNMGGNPDAAQDENLIRQILLEELGPIFEQIGSRLKDLEEDCGEQKDLLYKFAYGLLDAADQHKRGTLSEELSSKYGSEIEPFEGFHNEVYGKGLKDSLLEELMGEEAPGDEEREGWMKNRLGELKGKYGKYVGLKEEKPEEGPVEGEAEGEAEAEAEGLHPNETKEIVEEKKPGGKEIVEEEVEEGGEPEPEENDAIGAMMSQLKSLGGKAHKLSEPIMPRKRK
jgi:hypothetical protein